MSKLLTVFDNYEPLNNVVSGLTLKAEEVYLLYHHEKAKLYFKNITTTLKKYGIKRIHFVHLINDEKQINNILNRNRDIIVDVGGAKYISLLIFEQALKRNNRIIYFDDEENVIKDYRTHTVLYKDVFKLTIEDVLRLKGGKIKDYLHKQYHDAASKNTIIKLVENNLDNYQNLIRYIGKLNSILSNKSYRGNRTYLLDKDQIENIRTDSAFRRKEDLFTIKDNRLIFKTENLRKLICISGAIMENYIYLKLKESKKFDDVIMSAVIDFSDDKYRHPVRCELDIIVIKNNRLLFCSVKSSKADTTDLNEIYVHNARFGNALSKAVLCLGEELNSKFPGIYAKAEELDVYIVDRSSIENGLADTFLKIVNDTYTYDEL